MRWNMKADETVSECGNVCDECGIECPCEMWTCRGMVGVRDNTLCMFECVDME